MAIPVTLADAKRHLRHAADEDVGADRLAEINGFIADAAAWVERYTGHILVARDVEEQFTAFNGLQLRAWPVKPGAAVSVGYVDGAGAAIVVAGPRVTVARRPVAVLPAFGTRWPSVGAGLVTVTVRAGYEPNDTAPADFRRAMLVLIAAYDEDREGGDVLAKAVQTAHDLCGAYRARRLRWPSARGWQAGCVTGSRSSSPT